jgi:hypothetical protein
MEFREILREIPLSGIPRNSTKIPTEVLKYGNIKIPAEFRTD